MKSTGRWKHLRLILSDCFSLARGRNTHEGWIAEQAIETILEAAAKAYPRETGGILMGVLVRRRPWITHAVEITDVRATLHRYEVPAGSRPMIVDSVRKQQRSEIGYLGEWHAHPKDAGPSATDIESIRKVKNESQADCRNPFLLLARKTDAGYRLDSFRWRAKNLTPVTLLQTGVLPKNRTKGRFQL